MGRAVVHSPGYAYVHESVAEAFVDAAKKALVAMFGDDPKTNPDYSRIIDAREVSRLAGLIDPIKVLSGGRSDPAERYLDPTILYPVAWGDKVLDDKSLDEAVKRIAATARPLAGFAFSRDQSTIDRFVGELSFGGGAVNQVNIHLFIESMPFGGSGQSGMGNYYGKYGFDALTHAKSMLISPANVAIEHLFPPYTKEKVEALKQWFEY
jgi:aldehyde dehydrogenase (NAD+)